MLAAAKSFCAWIIPRLQAHFLNLWSSEIHVWPGSFPMGTRSFMDKFKCGPIQLAFSVPVSQDFCTISTFKNITFFCTVWEEVELRSHMLLHVISTVWCCKAGGKTLKPPDSTSMMQELVWCVCLFPPPTAIPLLWPKAIGLSSDSFANGTQLGLVGLSLDWEGWCPTAVGSAWGHDSVGCKVLCLASEIWMMPAPQPLISFTVAWKKGDWAVNIWMKPVD